MCPNTFFQTTRFLPPKKKTNSFVFVMSHGGIFGSDSDDSDDEQQPAVSVPKEVSKKPTSTSASTGGIFDSDSDDSDSDNEDVDLGGMSRLKPSASKASDRSAVVKKAAAAARRKREKEAAAKDRKHRPHIAGG